MSTKIYYYYSKYDESREPIHRIIATNRLAAAKWFAGVKRLSLKQFISLYSVSR